MAADGACMARDHKVTWGSNVPFTCMERQRGTCNRYRKASCEERPWDRNQKINTAYVSVPVCAFNHSWVLPFLRFIELSLCFSSKAHSMALASWNGFLLLATERPLISHIDGCLLPMPSSEKGFAVESHSLTVDLLTHLVIREAPN